VNPQPEHISRRDQRYLARLRERLRTDAPPALAGLGRVDLLTLAKTALFCSARCPGDDAMLSSRRSPTKFTSSTQAQAAAWSGCPETVGSNPER